MRTSIGIGRCESEQRLKIGEGAGAVQVGEHDGRDVGDDYST
jgi:hypothetical protein